MPPFSDPLGHSRKVTLTVSDTIGFESYNATTNKFMFNATQESDIGNFTLNITL